MTQINEMEYVPHPITEEVSDRTRSERVWFWAVLVLGALFALMLISGFIPR